MVHNNTTFAIGVAEETMKALKPKIDSGEVKIVFYDAVNPEDRDFTPILTKLRDLDMELIALDLKKGVHHG